MRVISQYRSYDGPTLQDERIMILADGQKQVLTVGRTSPFRYGDITEWERKAALDKWKGQFKGLTENEDPMWRLSSFDTDEAATRDGWTDEEKSRYEAILLNGPGNGSDYIIVERDKAPAPYLLYDKHRKVQGRRTLEHALTDIRGAFETAGFDVETAVIYERETLNDPTVIKALEGLVVAEAPEELVEA